MSGNPWGTGQTILFTQLDFDKILTSIDGLKLRTTGRILPLNSLENRVFEIELEEKYDFLPNNFVIAKFYRPGRWSKEQIEEEHQFLKDLHNNELPVIAPLEFDNKTIFYENFSGTYFALFPKKGGRLKAELNDEEKIKIARLLSRLHAIGKSRKSLHRLTLDAQTFGKTGRDIIIQEKIIPERMIENYKIITDQFLKQVEMKFVNIPNQRIHGDCHLGNIIWQDENPFIVDFDDMYNGPLVQDFWLFMPDYKEAAKDWEKFIEAYEAFNHFPFEQLKLIPYLRGLRQIHFNAWLCKRWHDPIFQRTFGHFTSEKYWDEHYNDLRILLSQILENQQYIYE